jgi:diguanylate cyclase (GGDEF)-like protein
MTSNVDAIHRRIPHGPAKAVALASLCLAVALALLAFAVASSQQQAHARIVSSFQLRATSSATFVSDVLAEQRAGAQPANASILSAIVAHTISYPQHEVYLVNVDGGLIAASPATRARSLLQADGALARAALDASSGPVPGAPEPSTFTLAPVPGRSWWLLVEVPDSRLYASIAGWTDVIPWLVFALVSVLGILLLAMLARSHADRMRLATLYDRLEQTARTDSLTGLLNRRALTDELTRAAARVRRSGEALSVLMIDLDRFKETNDRFGHEAGDRVLRALAACMRDTLRGEDAYGRWGGDEFLVALPGGDEREAAAVAARLREAAAHVDLADIGLDAGVPMSIGAATALSTATTPDEIVRAADLDLYRTKSARAHDERRDGGLMPSLQDATR